MTLLPPYVRILYELGHLSLKASAFLSFCFQEQNEKTLIQTNGWRFSSAARTLSASRVAAACPNTLRLKLQTLVGENTLIDRILASEARGTFAQRFGWPGFAFGRGIRRGRCWVRGSTSKRPPAPTRSPVKIIPLARSRPMRRARRWNPTVAWDDTQVDSTA